MKRPQTSDCLHIAQWLTLRFFAALLMLASWAAAAQTVYGVGGTPGTFVFDRGIYIVDPTTGLASTPTVPNSFVPNIAESVALAVSPLNGLVYLAERNVANPRIITWNPNNGVVTTIGNAGTPVGINTFIRSTFCPDGRYYLAGNGSAGGAGAEIYEINPANGALIRTIVVTNIPTAGSGDIVCTSNGDMYVIAQEIAAPNNYQLYRITANQIAAGAGNLSLAATFQGNSNIPNTQNFNGVSELPNGQLMASVAFTTGTIYSISPTTFAATTLTTGDFLDFADLSRGFAIGLTTSKSQSPTSLIQGTQTVTYSIVVNNAGPSVAQNVSVTDALPSAFTSVNWVCGVSNTGLTTTVVTTACSAASGSGNINNTVSLSIGGEVRYTITAVLPSTFTGTLTNVANSTIVAILTVSTPTATISTVTATVQPAVSLTVSKTNGVTTTLAGSTVSYTLTFSNFGPGDGSGSRIQDIPGAGLSNCSVVSCTGAGSPTPATCPATPALVLSPSTTIIPSFPANSSVTYVIQCGVSASGLVL